ncbi:MAG: hypothetical protein R3C56_40990 [Pirellulaceae bacterium]
MQHGQRNDGLLRQLAVDTGGNYWTGVAAAMLPDANDGLDLVGRIAPQDQVAFLPGATDPVPAPLAGAGSWLGSPVLCRWNGSPVAFTDWHEFNVVVHELDFARVFSSDKRKNLRKVGGLVQSITVLPPLLRLCHPCESLSHWLARMELPRHHGRLTLCMLACD